MHGTTGVLCELGGLVLAMGLLGRAAAMLGLSPIPLYLLAGLVLGAIGEGPLTFSPEVVEIGAEIGIVLLLFMLGLEYAGRDLAARLRTEAPPAAFDLLANMVPGIAAGLLLGWGLDAALVLGGVTYISSSGVFAKVVDDLDRRRHPETPAVLSLLVVEDLVMAAYLPLIAVIVAGVGLAGALVSLTGALVAAAVALAAALRYHHVVARALSPRTEEAFLLTTLGAVLVIAGLAELLHLSAAVGAFLAGIALSGPVVDRAREVLTPLRDLFAAAFFVFFGLQVDFGAAGGVVLPVIALIVVTSATKAATGWWAARRVGAGPDGRLRAATVLVARGEFSVVIAGIGVTAGLEPQLGPLAGAYVLATALAGTLLTRWADRPASAPPGTAAA